MDTLMLGTRFVVVEERKVGDSPFTTSPVHFSTKLDEAKRKASTYTNHLQRTFRANVFREKNSGNSTVFFHNTQGDKIQVRVTVRPCNLVAQL